jgi:hypothetical protein
VLDEELDRILTSLSEQRGELDDEPLTSWPRSFSVPSATWSGPNPIWHVISGLIRQFARWSRGP